MAGVGLFVERIVALWGVEWWISAAKLLIPAALGFAFGRVGQRSDRLARIRACQTALAAEVNLCEEQARIYLRDGIPAPVYRLSTAAFAASLHSILVDGGITKLKSVEDLLSFATFIQDINRGLDHAQKAREDDDQNRLKAECD
jgi:hypothetical protein